MADLRVGVAQVNYTPRLGLALMGNFRDDYGARGVHDPLMAKAVVFEEPGLQRAAILSVDICMLDRNNVSFMRNHIASRCPLRPEEILICATHTHSAPAPMALGSLPRCSDADVETFLTTAAQAVVNAFQDLSSARISAGHGTESRVSFNRRLRCRDGRTHMNWEQLDPVFVVEPLGPIDPRLTSLTITREGRPITAMVNFGLHPAILAGDNWLYSADFPAYLAEGLSRLQGPEFITLFLNGPCGDVNHLDYTDLLQGRGFQMTQRVGYMLAVSARETIQRSVPVEGTSIRLSHEKVALPRLRITEEERAWCERVIAEAERSNSPGLVDGLPDEFYARTRLKMYRAQHTDDLVEVMAIRIGDVGIVGLPGEILCELGIAIAGRSPARHTLIVELANDAIGYIPTREAYAQGGYEVTPGATWYQPGCGEALMEAAVRQLTALLANKENRSWRNKSDGEYWVRAA